MAGYWVPVLLYIYIYIDAVKKLEYLCSVGQTWAGAGQGREKKKKKKGRTTVGDIIGLVTVDGSGRLARVRWGVSHHD